MNKLSRLSRNVPAVLGVVCLLFLPLAAHAGAPALATGGLSGYAIDAKGVLYGWGDGAGGVGAQASHPVVIGGGYAAVAVGGISSDTHAVAIKTDGSLWTMGGNGSGQLGDGTSYSSDIPRQIGPTGVTFVTPAAGDTFSFAIASDHKLWAWGGNKYGQLGDNTVFTPRSKPVMIGSDFASVAAGSRHTLALKTDGSLWAWGDNSFGQLGDGTTTQRNAPVKIGEGYTAISAGVDFSLGLKADGSLWAWGDNRDGQLGDGTTTQRTLPTRSGGARTFSQISAGGYHAIAVGNDAARTLYYWGDNSKGQLGETAGAGGGGRFRAVGDGGNVNLISAGRFHSSVLGSDGTLRAFGGNDFGQLADGSLRSRHHNGYAVNAAAADLFDLDPSQQKKIDVSDLYTTYNYLVSSDKKRDALNVTLTDKRVAGSPLSGTVYFTALVPAKSALLKGVNRYAAGGGMVAGCLVPTGLKQSSPGVACTPNTSGDIRAGSQFPAYEGAATDPTADPNAVICMGLTTPALSAKGQVMMRPIAGGDFSGVTQCPTVQTPATLQLYKSQVSGATNNRTVVAVIQPQPEDTVQMRNLYAWAVARDGTQFMQINDNQWVPMSDPMQPVKTVTVPLDGSPVILPMVAGVDLTHLIGTLVYVGLGESWADVKSLNKAGHVWTVE